MPGQRTIHIELVNEGVRVWRPVLAAHVRSDVYLIPDATPIPDGEEWAFSPGQLVRCEGAELRAVERVDATTPETPGIPRVPIPFDRIADFCRRWLVTEFSLFGSVLRDDFGPESDVDVLVSFSPHARWSYWEWPEMESELGRCFGRRVDLVEKRSISNPFRRHRILTTRRMLYAA